jgi:hypothetical protein
LIVTGSGWMIYSLISKATGSDEMQMAIMVVVGIATLMSVLFVLAAGFSSMNLTDPKQPLGLPEGSIRSMIALILIMVFIIFGIYLFRMVGGGTYIRLENAATSPDTKNYTGKVIIEKNIVAQGQQQTYSVWSLEPIGEDGRRLAQQLLTTVGTLVVAVAGFYFGSTAVSSAVAAVQPSTSTLMPVIREIAPKEGSKGQQVNLEIVGSGFRSPRNVRLVRGNEIIEATSILSNESTINCKLLVDKEPDGKWDIIVENPDGKQGRLAEAFTIKA